MNIDIATTSKQFRDGLSIEDWLSRLAASAGPIVERSFLPFSVEFVQDRQQVNKLMKANSWANVDLENFNMMLAFVDREPSIANKNIINDLAVAGHGLLRGLKARVGSKLAENDLKGEVFDFCVTPIVVRAFQEFYLSRCSGAVPLDFATNLLRILNDGHLPCGWRSTRGQSASCYDPLAYIEDSFRGASDRKLQSFDYSSGILHVL